MPTTIEGQDGAVLEQVMQRRVELEFTPGRGKKLTETVTVSFG
jgi:hypothetical protein